MIFAAAAALALLIAVGALWYVVRGFARGRELDRALDADSEGPGLSWALLIAVGAEVGAGALIVLAVALIT